VRRISLMVGIVAVLALAAAPAAAQAKFDLAISTAPSARIIDVGHSVSFQITVANRGTVGSEAVFVNLYSLRGHGQGANNPYTSVTTSQGTCKDESGPAFGYQYYSWVCELGPLAPGASAMISATVTVNESMNHFAALLPNAYEGGYYDDDNSNNTATNRITANAPPTIAGSKAIKIKGLPHGCVPGNFTLRASTKAPGVKKMSASMDLGFDQEGVGHSWQKVVPGKKLVATVPGARLEPELGATYKVHVKAKRGGGRKLEAIVTLKPCGA
jgi:hypothetical protein